ncbi:MAG: DMT family transporter [Oscillospiraceae bacterium]|nr:DMT family transporter [Oscillospiraceae bacterium]
MKGTLSTVKISKKNMGVLLIILSAVCFTGMNACVRLSGDLPSIQKSFFRNAVAAVFAAVMLVRSRTPLKIQKGCGIAMLMRAVCGTVGVFCNFYAVDHLALADASMLNKLSPFFAVVFSIIILKEKASPAQVAAVILAFCGSLFIIRPTFSNMELVPSLIGFAGGMGAGAAYTFVRYMKQRGEKSALIVFCFSVFSCTAALPIMLADFAPMSAKQLGILILTGLFAAGGQFAITGAYSYAPAKEVSVFDYSQVIFSAVAGYFIFGQTPVPLSVIGYVIIIGSAVWTFIQNNKRENANA